MNDATYNGAWDAVEPILEEYTELRRDWSFTSNPGITQEKAERIRQHFDEKIRSVLRPFGISYVDICLELDRRVRRKVRNAHENRKASYRNR